MRSLFSTTFCNSYGQYTCAADTCSSSNTANLAAQGFRRGEDYWRRKGATIHSVLVLYVSFMDSAQ